MAELDLQLTRTQWPGLEDGPKGVAIPILRRHGGLLVATVPALIDHLPFGGPHHRALHRGDGTDGGAGGRCQDGSDRAFRIYYNMPTRWEEIDFSFMNNVYYLERKVFK